MTRAKIITVKIESTENGLLRATSDDLLGLHVVASNSQRLKELTKDMLCDLFEARGERVSVYESEDISSAQMPPWVIVPENDHKQAC